MKLIVTDGSTPADITITDPEGVDEYEIDDPTKSGDQFTTIFEASQYAEKLSEANTKASSVRSGVDSLADGVYNQYEAGDLNMSDIVRPTTIAKKAGTNANTTGGNQYAAIQLAALGYSGDLNSSTTVNVTVNGSTTQYDGTLFYTADDLDHSRPARSTTSAPTRI